MCDNDECGIHRRSILKTTGAGLAAAGSLATTASAQSAGTECAGCLNAEEVAEDDTYRVTLVEHKEGTYIIWVNKQARTVSYRAVEGDVQALSDDDFGVSADGTIRPTNHEDIVEQWDYWQNDHGSCGGYIYSNHYSAGYSITTGDALDEYPSGALEAALCGVAGAVACKHWACAALGAIVCFTIGYFVLDHIDMSGTDLTVGAWDCHTGWAGEESVCIGGSLSYTSDKSDLIQTHTVKGPHLELGEDIEEHL